MANKAHQTDWACSARAPPPAGPPSQGLTDSEAERVERVPVDAVQLVHERDAELHRGADVGVLPLQVLRDTALSGSREGTPRLPASTGWQST